MMLPCAVICDLLPQYMEKLTGEETTRLIDEHLETCENCRKIKADMDAQLPIKKASKPKLEFLKKLRRRNIIGAVLTVIAALLCISFAYKEEYIDVVNTSSIENAINERLGGFEDIDVNVLDSKKVGGSLFVLFEQLNSESDMVSGFAHLRRGLFGGYCFKAVSHSDWPLFTFEAVEAGSKNYLVIYGIYEPAGAESFKIYPEDFPPSVHGEPPRDYSTIEPLYTGTVETPLFRVIPITQEQADSVYMPTFAHYYDAETNELDAKELAEKYGYDGSSGGGTSYSYQGALYFFCVIILLLAIAFVRYFIKP